MASIQCAIELYDGVSPVFSQMALSLDQFSGQFTRFAGEMDALTPDVEGLRLFGGALGNLAAEAEGAYGVMSALLTAGEGLLGVFSTEIFVPLTEGTEYAIREVTELFDGLRVQITETFDGISRHAAGTAERIPGHFAGPLMQVTGMFHAMAADIRAALESITNGVQSAIGAANQARSAVQIAPQVMSVDSGLESESFFSVPNREEIALPSPERYWTHEEALPVAQTVVTVSVQNENHIAQDVDVDAVLREMEVRICDAIASSAEGVYV